MIFGLTFELGPQHRILGCDSHRTRSQMADSHHDAPLGHEWDRRESKFIRSEKRRDNHISPGPQLTIDLETDSASQSVPK